MLLGPAQAIRAGLGSLQAGQEHMLRHELELDGSAD